MVGIGNICQYRSSGGSIGSTINSLTPVSTIVAGNADKVAFHPEGITNKFKAISFVMMWAVRVQLHLKLVGHVVDTVIVEHVIEAAVPVPRYHLQPLPDLYGRDHRRRGDLRSHLVLEISNVHPRAGKTLLQNREMGLVHAAFEAGRIRREHHLDLADETVGGRVDVGYVIVIAVGIDVQACVYVVETAEYDVETGYEILSQFLNLGIARICGKEENRLR